MEFWLYTGASIAIPIGYVCSLYLFDRGEFYPHSHPTTIKRRFVGIAISTSASVLATYGLLELNYADPLRQMGIYYDDNLFGNTLKAVLITWSIYLGTILMDYLDGSWKQWFSKFKF
jgi:hypothetical protein